MRSVLLLVALLVAPTLPAGAQDAPQPKTDYDLVLIHGLGAAAGIWDEFVPYVSYVVRTHVYELHGHGQTTPLATPTIAAEAAALHEWLATQGIDQPTLVGHGLGGMIALQYTLDHPAQVRRLVMIDATPRQLAEPEQRAAVREALRADYDRFVAARFLTVSEDQAVADRAVDMALRTDSTTLAALLLSSFDWDVSEELATLSVPLFVIGSENFLPDAGYERQTLTAYGFGEARRMMFKRARGSGHYVMLEEPSYLAEMLLNYIREHVPQ